MSRASLPRGRLVAGGLAFLLLYVTYFLAFRGHVIASVRNPDDPRPALLFALAVTVFAFFTLLAAVRVGQSFLERRRLGAMAGGAPLRDDDFAAVDGIARSEGKLLTAPFSGRPCLAYEYEVRIPGASSGSGSRFVGLAGIALAPLSIEGARGRPRLLGWSPLGQQFPCERLDADDDRRAAQRLATLVKQTRFEKMTGTKGLRLIGRLFDLQSDPDGSLRQDWCFDERALSDHEGATIAERVVTPGMAVGASGLWSEKDNGLHGQVGRVGLDVWPGTIADRRRRLLSAPLGQLAFLAFLTIALHGMVALVWKSSEEVAQARAELARKHAADAFQEALSKRDLPAARVALRAGGDVNRRDHYGSTFLMWAPQWGPEWVQMLIEEGADIEAVHPRWGSALTQAITGKHQEAIDVLRAAGARDFRITAENGRPLPRDGGRPLVVVRNFYAAIERADRPTVDALFTMALEGDIDWDLWRRVRPLAIESAQGYATETAATFSVRGRDPKGRARVWAYHVVIPPSETGDSWRIEREWELE